MRRHRTPTLSLVNRLRSARYGVSVPATAIVLAGLLLSGCGTAGPTGSSGRTLRIWYGTDDPVERAWSQQLAHAFQQTHSAVQVQLVDYSFADLNTKLQLALAAGNPPDLAYVTPRGPGIPVYVQAHRLRDLTTDARIHSWSSRLQPGLLAAYNQAFAFYGGKPGHIVAVPTSLAAAAIMYNKRLIHRLHLQIPTSLPAFEAALVRAKAAGYTPLGMGNADGWLGDDWYLTLVNALSSSASFQGEQRLDPSFSFRRTVFFTAGRILQHWSQKGYFTTDFGGLDAQEGVDQFFHGTTLFQLVSSSENSQILQDQRQTRLPIGVFAFPHQNGGGVVPVSGYLGWVVPGASRNPSDAVSFINDLLTPTTAIFLAHQGVLPAQNVPCPSSHPTCNGLPAPASWFDDYVRAYRTAQHGVYLDAAPLSNLNATMEANVQLLLQGYEPPDFLVKSLQEVYASHGNRGSTARIDGEF